MPRPRSLSALCAVWLAAGALSGSPALSQDDPANLHHETLGMGVIEESPEAMKVSTVIQCFCGGCVNQTIHECTCSFAAAERAKIASALEQGTTAEGIIAQYVSEHGPQIRIVPERRGFNLIGWAVPWAVAVAGLVALGIVLVAWSRRTREAALGAEAAAGPVSPEDQRWREKVEKKLSEMES